MARDYTIDDFSGKLLAKRHQIISGSFAVCIAAWIVSSNANLNETSLILLAAIIPALAIFIASFVVSKRYWLERERKKGINQ